MTSSGDHRANIVEIREAYTANAVNDLLKTGEWEIVWVRDAFSDTHYVLGRHASIAVAAETTVLEVKTVTDDETANNLLRSGKWRLLHARVVQHARVADGNVVQGGQVCYIFGCTKP